MSTVRDNVKFEIDPEVRGRMFDASEFCDQELEKSIVDSGGPREKLTVGDWMEGDRMVTVLLDGHRRLAVCEKHGLQYQIELKQFADRAAAFAWMDREQLCRRNLNSSQESIVRARLVTYRSDGHGTIEKTIEEVARDTNVCPRTVRRDIQFAESMSKLAPELESRAQHDFTKKDVKALAKLTPEDQVAAVAQFDKGEFSSVAAAAVGERNVDEVVTLPATEQKISQTDSPIFNAAYKLLGKLKRKFGEISESHPHSANTSVARMHLDRLSLLLDKWDKERRETAE